MKDENVSDNHHIVILYIKKDDIFYILDTSGMSQDYTYFENARKFLFGNSIIVKSVELLQRLEGSISDYEGENKGYYVAWSYFLIRCYIINDNEVSINKLIKIIIPACNSGENKLSLMMRRLIRNFTHECIYG